MRNRGNLAFSCGHVCCTDRGERIELGVTSAGSILPSDFLSFLVKRHLLIHVILLFVGVVIIASSL